MEGPSFELSGYRQGEKTISYRDFTWNFGLDAGTEIEHSLSMTFLGDPRRRSDITCFRHPQSGLMNWGPGKVPGGGLPLKPQQHQLQRSCVVCLYSFHPGVGRPGRVYREQAGCPG